MFQVCQNQTGGSEVLKRFVTFNHRKHDLIMQQTFISYKHTQGNCVEQRTWQLTAALGVCVGLTMFIGTLGASVRTDERQEPF